MQFYLRQTCKHYLFGFLTDNSPTICTFGNCCFYFRKNKEAPETANNSKANTTESAPSVLIPPLPPAETAELTSPLTEGDNKKVAPVGATNTNSTEMVVNAVKSLFVLFGPWYWFELLND
jgi:hypothetical protein